MRIKLLVVLALSALLAISRGLAAESTNGISAEFKQLFTKIQTKLRAQPDGTKLQEKDLAPELKEFDNLLAKHKGEKSDDVANVLMMKAMLYLQVLDNEPKGIELINQVKKDYPDTQPGKRADQILATIEKQAEAKKIQATLVEGSKFPDFTETDLAGKPLSIASHKGKVVLVDFWATWCGPCVRELPTVMKTYEKHHGEGLEIIGISLDEEREALDNFIKEKKVPWAQYFDGKGWQSKLGTKYGIDSIPATFLLDGEGKIIGKDLRGEELEAAVVKALAKK